MEGTWATVADQEMTLAAASEAKVLVVLCIWCATSGQSVGF